MVLIARKQFIHLSAHLTRLLFIDQTPLLVKEFVGSPSWFGKGPPKQRQNFLDIFPHMVKMHGFRDIKPEVNVPWQK
jgi:hypothetical protein